MLLMASQLGGGPNQSFLRLLHCTTLYNLFLKICFIFRWFKEIFLQLWAYFNPFSCWYFISSLVDFHDVIHKTLLVRCNDLCLVSLYKFVSWHLHVVFMSYCLLDSLCLQLIRHISFFLNVSSHVLSSWYKTYLYEPFTHILIICNFVCILNRTCQQPKLVVHLFKTLLSSKLT